MKYQAGNLFFWKGSGLFSYAISVYNLKNFHSSEATHIGIISQVEKDRVLIHEATNKGFVSSWYEIWWLEAREKEGKVHIGKVKHVMKNVFENCEKYKGIRYGWLDIVGISMSLLFGWKVIGITGKNSVICSEAVTRIVYDSTDGKVAFGYNPRQPKEKKTSEYPIVFDAVSPMHIFKSKSVEILK